VAPAGKHAVALIGALMLDADSQNPPTPVAMPKGPEPPGAKPTAQSLTESLKVIMPPPTKLPVAPTHERQIRSFTVAPWFSLTLDTLAAPDVRFGPRAGVLVTLQRLLPGSQQTLRVSMAQVRSGTITKGGNREANITWTSVRLDVCHGSSSQQLSSLGMCAWFDVGKWNGEGWVDRVRREKGVYWSRLGGAAQLRQRIVGGTATRVHGENRRRGRSLRMKSLRCGQASPHYDSVPPVTAVTNSACPFWI
jgi:hypothetical protein